MNIAELTGSGLLPLDFSEYVDAGEGIKRVAGNQGIYVRLLKSYLSSQEFDKLKEQAASGDIGAAAATAHGIKGIAGNLSLARLYNTTIEFEGQLKQGAFGQETSELFFQAHEKTKEYVGLLIEKLES
ncbi:MAG: Hpt domain-containing protein [Clostridiales Family XIII bacterium]|nr:Hpt domain-containing protein [Clostridiales Family XIII bacterium]